MPYLPGSVFSANINRSQHNKAAFHSLHPCQNPIAMYNDNRQQDIRRTRIYKGLYRPSSNLSRFLGTILSILLRGQSQVGNTDPFYFRKHR